MVLLILKQYCITIIVILIVVLRGTIVNGSKFSITMTSPKNLEKTVTSPYIHYPILYSLSNIIPISRSFLRIVHISCLFLFFMRFLLFWAHSSIHGINININRNTWVLYWSSRHLLCLLSTLPINKNQNTPTHRLYLQVFFTWQSRNRMLMNPCRSAPPGRAA